MSSVRTPPMAARTWMAPRCVSSTCRNTICRRGPTGGANLEIGKTSLRVSEQPWNAQLKGILGYRTGPWSFAANPNVDWSLSPGGGAAQLSLDFKVAYAVVASTRLGIESYNGLGPVSGPGPLAGYAKSLYVAVDHDFGGVDLNAGVGRGLTSAADVWTVKFIVGTHF